MARALWKSNDPALWAQHAQRYDRVAREATARFTRGAFVSVDSEARLQAITAQLKGRSPAELSRAELLAIRDWKMSRNAFRPGWRQIENAKNSDAAVRSATREVFALVVAGDWLGALRHADKHLFGVGPATASIFLAMASDDLPFFGEEAVTASGARGPTESATYSLKGYAAFCEAMQARARELRDAASAGHTALSPVEMERALFVAARAPPGGVASGAGQPTPAKRARLR